MLRALRLLRADAVILAVALDAELRGAGRTKQSRV
jgi:hypothetical protein